MLEYFQSRIFTKYRGKIRGNSGFFDGGKMKLTKTLCNNLAPKDRSYKKFDGGGLYLEVMPNGNKLWRYKYYYQGGEKRFSLGKYPIVTLVDAREKRLQAQRLLEQGIDPSSNKIAEEKLARRNHNNTFELVAREWHEKKKGAWSDSHAKNVLHRLESNVFPHIGKAPVTKITAPDLLEALQILEARNALEVASRTRQICSQVFRYAIQTGRCENNPAIHLSGALKTKKVQHFAALEIKDVPEFLKILQRNEARLFSRTRRAILLSLLTFARPGEVRQCRWEHVDINEAIWTIPGELMKSGRDHIVPLSSQAIRVILDQQDETGRFDTPWVFPGQVRPQIPMSEGTVNMGLKRLGYHQRMTAHGFRALARTTIREKLNYYPDIIEAQLAHKPSGPLGAAYDRAQFLEERKKMMQDWADYLDNTVQ